jgi:hypothetical protein
MKKRTIILTALLATVACGQASAVDIVSSFEDADEGWTVIGLTGGGPYNTLTGGPYTPTFSRPGGNPGGYISYYDDPSPNIEFHFSAPVRFLGNQSSSYGLRLLYDVRTSGGDSDWAEADVILAGTNNMVIVVDTGPNPSTTWTRRSVYLTESAGWRVGSLNGRVPTRDEFLAVLFGLSALRIRGEYRNGYDTGFLDNVVLESGRIDMSIRVSQVEVCWSSIPSRRYQVQWRTDIEASTGTDLGASVVGTGDKVCVTDQVADDQPRRFYRVVELP